MNRPSPRAHTIAVCDDDIPDLPAEIPALDLGPVLGDDPVDDDETEGQAGQ